MTRSPVEDELEIRNLVARAALFADGPDVEAYVALFTEDAVWAMPGAPRRGWDDLRAGSLERRAAGQIGPGTHTRHVVTNVAVTVAGDAADADAYWQFVVDTDTTPRVSLMGTYRDHFVRTPDGWRISHRAITIDGVDPDATTTGAPAK